MDRISVRVIVINLYFTKHTTFYLSLCFITVLQTLNQGRPNLQNNMQGMPVRILLTSVLLYPLSNIIIVFRYCRWGW